MEFALPVKKTAARRNSKRRTTDTFSLNAAKMIDAEFAKVVWVSIGGKRKRVTTFYAIFYQLAQRAHSDRRALRVLSRYLTYARSKGGLGGRVRVVLAPPPEEES